jgi:hypothetical protein
MALWEAKYLAFYRSSEGGPVQKRYDSYGQHVFFPSPARCRPQYLPLRLGSPKVTDIDKGIDTASSFR